MTARPVVVVAAEKQCPQCGQVKNLSEFHRNVTRPDGRTFYCADCNNARVTAYQAAQRAADPDGWKAKVAENVRRHRQTNPESVERNRRFNRAQNAAIRRLKEAHPKEWRHLLEVAKREVGL